MIQIRCTHEDCTMPTHEVPDIESAKKIGAAHYKHKGHAIRYDR